MWEESSKSFSELVIAYCGSTTTIEKERCIESCCRLPSLALGNYH